MREMLRHSLAPFFPDQRIFIGYMVSALVLAFFAYISLRKVAAKEGLDLKGGFFAFVFDKDVYGHKSAKQDYWFFVANAVIFYAFVIQYLVGQDVFYSVSNSLFVKWWGPLQKPLLTSAASMVLYTIIAALVIDFAAFITHYFMHKNPVLWHFHKVHHSAEVLTPITLYRMHPVDLAFTVLATAILGGTALGLFFYLAGKQPGEYTIFGLNIVIFLFYVLGYNLRHSHVWLSYPQWLSHVLVSPAQHQIHHSTDPKHMDRNLGLVFAFWDWLYGTLYVPKSFEKIEYGITRKERNPFNSVTDLFIMPFRDAWKTFRKNDKARRNFLRIALVTLWIVLIAEILNIDIQKQTISTVNLEDLTWTEVRLAQDKGYDTIIIPTGGTEQNGPHMILGKHNYIVHYTAQKVAEKAGKALVAPVMSYVPEGSLDEKATYHMPYPGTITVPDDVFEGLLRAAAESFIHHGFKYIFFLGDSYNNQEPQRLAAEQLMKKWSGKGVVIATLNKYYDANGQFDWLKAQGYNDAQIGYHAGMRDTSELMAVRANGVRNHPLLAKDNELPYMPEGTQGYSGDAGKASASIGKQMLKLKIDTAVGEIRAVRKDAPHQ